MDTATLKDRLSRSIETIYKNERLFRHGFKDMMDPIEDLLVALKRAKAAAKGVAVASKKYSVWEAKGVENAVMALEDALEEMIMGVGVARGKMAFEKDAAVRISPEVAGRILKQFRFKVSLNGVNRLAREAMAKLLSGKVPSGPTLTAKERKAKADEDTIKRLRMKFKDAALTALGPNAKKDLGIIPMDIALVAQEFALDAWVQYLGPRSR